MVRPARASAGTPRAGRKAASEHRRATGKHRVHAGGTGERRARGARGDTRLRARDRGSRGREPRPHARARFRRPRLRHAHDDAAILDTPCELHPAARESAGRAQSRRRVDQRRRRSAPHPGGGGLARLIRSSLTVVPARHRAWLRARRARKPGDRRADATAPPERSKDDSGAFAGSLRDARHRVEPPRRNAGSSRGFPDDPPQAEC